MSARLKRLARRAASVLARHTPYLRDKLVEFDRVQAQNIELQSLSDRLIASNKELDDKHSQALSALADAGARRKVLEENLRTTAAQLEGSETARQQIDIALRQARRQFEEAETARRNATAQLEEAQAALRVSYRPKHRTDAEQREWAIATLNGAASKAPTRERPTPTVQRKQPSKITKPVTSGRNGASAADLKISVVLPNYNHGRFIKGNIDGVRAQTYRNWEMVIVDDGSTDESRDIIQAAADADSRIIPIFMPTNGGALIATAAGMNAATGELIYGSAADDYIDNERFFELVIAALRNHPQACGAFAKASVVDVTSGEPLWHMGSAPVVGFVPPQQALQTFLTGGLFVPGASAIWRRSWFDALGGFDDALGPQADYFVNHALPALTGAVFINEVVTIVRAGGPSYHSSATEEEFFTRHGLLEGKLRALDLPAAPDPKWLSVWRDRTVNGRLAVRRQQDFFDLIRAALGEIKPWEREALMPHFADYSSRTLEEVARLEKDLAERILSAYETFDATAGPIPGSGEAPRSVAS